MGNSGSDDADEFLLYVHDSD